MGDRHWPQDCCSLYNALFFIPSLFLFCFSKLILFFFFFYFNLVTLGKNNNLRVPWRPVFQRVKPRTEKLEAELKRHTPSQCLVHTFLTLLAPLTAIISGVTGTATLSYLVLWADPNTQPWSKTIWSPTCDRITIQSQRTSRHWSPSPIFLTSLSANVALLEVLGIAKLSWSQTFAFPLQVAGADRAPEADARRKTIAFWNMAVSLYLQLNAVQFLWFN